MNFVIFITKENFSIIILLLCLIISPSLAFAVPTVFGVSKQAGIVTVTGSGFTVKSVPAPLVFTNFSTDTVGQVPSGWISKSTTKSVVSNTNPRTGFKSLDSSALNIATSEYFNRITYDLNSTIPLSGYLYLSIWMYLDPTGTTATGWNWKGPLITSSATTTKGTAAYWEAAGTTTTNTALGFAGFYSGTNVKWYNVAGTIQYSADNTAAYNYCSAGNGWAPDAFLFGGWQRVEWIIKPSSAPGLSDGKITVIRVGKSTPSLAATGCLTHGNTSDLWRYVSLPQGFTNISGGILNLKMIFNDVYIDNTIARVEICDASSWTGRSHCEIQPPINWADGNILFRQNAGTFKPGQDAYLYIVDTNGSVNSAGYPYKITGSPTTPLNLRGTKVP